MNHSIKSGLKSAFHCFGIDVSRLRKGITTEDRRLSMMKHLGIDTVIDVGANVGQYATKLRESGYTGDILSFEPLTAAYEALRIKSSNDPRWQVFHFAIGNANGTAEINVSGNSYSSSLLPMLDAHIQAAPDSRYLSTERVIVKTLDDTPEELLPRDRRLLLKIDTQGYEPQVLAGGRDRLKQVYLIECELSLVPLYEGQCLFQDMLNGLDRLGFKPVHFEPAFTDDATGYCLQLDGIFARSLADTFPLPVSGTTEGIAVHAN